MKLPNERHLLPIIRDAVTDPERSLTHTMEGILPLYEEFLASGKDKDEYRGWAFDLIFNNAAQSDYEPFRSAIASTDSDWNFFSESKDDCTYAVPGKGLIKIHLHSFLWNL